MSEVEHRQIELIQVESSQKQHHEDVQHQLLLGEINERLEYNLFALLKPKLYKDGDNWCVLYGDDIQSGICGFGETPYKAILDFNSAWHKPIKIK